MYHPAFHFYGFPLEDNPLLKYENLKKELDPLELPYIKFCLSDKSNFAKANGFNNYRDLDDDFLIDENENILPNINFVFVNVLEFSEVSINFEQYKRYCNFEKHTREYKEFWGRELYRRKYGLTRNCKLLFSDIEEYINIETTEERKKELLQPLHITGDHYTYLNYSRIMRTPTDEELSLMDDAELIESNGLREGFPIFIDGDYWDFKVDLFAKTNKKDLAKAKARRKGYSYKEGSKGSNQSNLYKNTRILYLAYKINYLTDDGAISSMVKTNLDWIEQHTHFKRGILSKVLTNIKLGYKSSDGKMDLGWGSTIFSRACEKNTNQAIGKQAVKIVYEESGAFPNIDEVVDLTRSVNEVGRIKIGMSTYFGTGGTKEANYLKFKLIFRKPKAFGCLNMRNIYDYNSTHQACGFYYPQVLGLFPYIKDGNSQLITGFYDDMEDKLKAKKEKSYDEYVAYLGQRANTPVEAFISNIENIYSSPELNQHLINLETESSYRFWRDGEYRIVEGKTVFVNNSEIQHPHVFIEQVPFDPKRDTTGCVREYFPPHKQDNLVVKDKYLITYDCIKVAKDNTTLTRKHSLASIQVWDRSNWTLMAEYLGRLNNPDDIDLMVLNFCNYWNSKVLAEVNVGEIVKNFKNWNALKFLEKDPTSIINTGNYDPKASYGVVIPNGLSGFKYYGFLQELMYRKISIFEDGSIKYGFHNVYSIPLIKSMQMFDLDLNLDALAAARIAGLYYKAYGELNDKYINGVNKKKTMAERLKNIDNKIAFKI